MDRVDVLITTSVNPKYDNLLLESLSRKHIPIIAELLKVRNEETVVAVDNYHAACDIGRQAGQFARQHWDGKAYVLDLTYSLPNTQLRSRGFAAGLHEVIPDAEIVLSINAQSRYSMAYQLTRDALAVHKQINIIFAINDTTAWGAIQACRDLSIDPGRLSSSLRVGGRYAQERADGGELLQSWPGHVPGDRRARSAWKPPSRPTTGSRWSASC